MKASAISDALRVLMGAHRPVFICGGPGVGKSSVVKQLAETLNVPLRDVRALLLDPVDLRGLPFLGSDGRSKWATPEFLPQNGAGILFLDELNTAPSRGHGQPLLSAPAFPGAPAILQESGLRRAGSRACSTQLPRSSRCRLDVEGIPLF